MPAITAVAMVGVITAAVILVPCLLFGAWLVHYTQDVTSLREGGRYLTRIPMPFRRRRDNVDDDTGTSS